MPTHLLSAYKAAQEDKELLSTRDDIALVDSRINELLSRVRKDEQGPEGSELWIKIRAGFRLMSEQVELGNAAKSDYYMREVSAMLEEGTKDYFAWREIGQLLDKRRGLAEAERKRQLEMRQLLTSEQAILLMNKVLEALQESVRHYLSEPEDRIKANKILAGVGSNLRGILS